MESVIATNVPTPDSDSSSFEKPTPTPDSDSTSFKKPTPTPAVLKTDSDSRLRLQLKTCDSTDSDSRLRLHNPGRRGLIYGDLPTKLAAAASLSYKIGGGKDLTTLLAVVLTWSGYWLTTDGATTS